MDSHLYLYVGSQMGIFRMWGVVNIHHTTFQQSHKKVAPLTATTQRSTTRSDFTKRPQGNAALLSPSDLEKRLLGDMPTCNHIVIDHIVKSQVTVYKL